MTTLRVFGLGKSYAAEVLSDVDFALSAGEVHALVGENGAGKSTLAGIIAGIISPSRGKMELDGAAFTPTEKADAESQGIRIVLQELNLIENLTVAENIFLDRMPRRFGFVDYKKLNRDAHSAMSRLGLDGLDPGRLVRSLGIGQQQLVEIAAAIFERCRILIMDEPTAALTETETRLLFEQIGKLKRDGVAILYISHRLEELQRIADRVTIIRDGRVVTTRQRSEIGSDEIVRLMVGRELSGSLRREAPVAAKTMLRVRNLSRGTAVRNVHFDLMRGEILGFAGLMGSGRTETMRALFGADEGVTGEVYLGGSNEPAVIRSPRDAVAKGIALLTEDRKSQGLLGSLSIRVNVTLARLAPLAGWLGWVNRGRERSAVAGLVQSLAIRCLSSEQNVSELSGGNQQKVVMARWLYRDSNVLIFDEPTRGIDVGARFEIYRLLIRLAESGKALIIVSSDLKEVMMLCDRIAVMSAGKLARIFSRDSWSEDEIMSAALSELPGAGSK